MEKVIVNISRAKDGTYTAYCADCTPLIGMGDNVDEAVAELKETIRITKEEIGRENAAFYPEWLDKEFEFVLKWDMEDLLTYYAGIITPAALGRISGINPKQIWAYMHGKSKPRKAQTEKIELALHKLGSELLSASF